MLLDAKTRGALPVAVCFSQCEVSEIDKFCSVLPKCATVTHEVDIGVLNNLLVQTKTQLVACFELKLVLKVILKVKSAPGVMS